MIEAPPDISTTLFLLPPDAKLVPVSELSARLQAKIGAVDHGHAVVTRPGFRTTTRLIPKPLADLIAEFRAPSLLTDGVLRFARAHDQDPLEVLDLGFDALAALVDARILVPEGSPDASAPTPSLAAGQELAGFEIQALVRSLEDSEVYRAQGPGQVVVALKLARDDRPDVQAMLASEARMLARLGSADSPALVASGVEQGRTYVAMEWCDGVSIAVAAQQARAAGDRRRLHAMLGRLLDAYARLHQRGVLHGDIHPGNCLVRDDGRVVILDFGHARAIDSPTTSRTGIPQFYDPQMAAAVRSREPLPPATVASEQYALAVLGYLLVTGLQPIEAPAVHDELLRRIVERPPLPFAARSVPAWPEVEAVLGRALAKQPGERFPDVAAMARAFAAASIRPRVAPRRSAGARRAFDDAVEAVRTLATPVGACAPTWFALRAALALDDAELLAAADVLARRGGASWEAQALAANVARARSDARLERTAIAGFLAAAELLSDRAETAAALVAATTLLEGTVTRVPEAAAVAAWTTRRLAELAPAGSLDAPADLALARAALALCKSGVVEVTAELRSRLDALADRRAGDVWLWALAHDVLADDRFRACALTAELPRPPLLRGLALLRLHQLTGDPRHVRAVGRVLARAPHAGLSALDTALLVAELEAPERALPPPYLLPRR